MKSMIQKQVLASFNKLGDLVSTMTYTAPGSGAYDPSTGQVAAGTAYEFAGVMTTFEFGEINGTTVLAQDRKVVLPALDLGFEPQVSGTITHNGRVFQIIAFRKDPAESSYTIQVRS